MLNEKELKGHNTEWKKADTSEGGTTWPELNLASVALRVLLHVPSPQFDASYLVYAKISPEKGCHGGGWEFPLAAMNMSLFASASSPVARDHWGKKQWYTEDNFSKSTH